MILEVMLASVIAAAGGNGAPQGEAPVASRLQIAPAETVDQLWSQLGEAIRAEDMARALALAVAIAEHPDFAAEPDERRYRAKVLLGLLYAEDGQDAAALPHLMEATQRPGAPVDVWFTRITSHARLGDHTGAARAMIKLLGLHPEVAPDVSGDFVLQLEGRPELDPEAAFDLRKALRDAGWRDRYDTWVWMGLIDDLLKRDRLDEAVPLVERITVSGGLIQLHAMRRYDGLRRAAGTPDLDIDAVLDAELAQLRTEAEASDATFEARNAYASGLFERGRMDEALAFAEATLALPAPEAGTPDDADRTWTMDTRARLLMELGRRDEAIAQMELAAKREEGGGANVSQTINLGWFYLRAGENARAIEAVKSLQPDNASPFGVMQAMHVRACAGAALGDDRLAGPAFAHMERNWRDAPMTWVEAQTCRGDTDGASDTLVLVLADENLADQAVVAMHSYLVQQRSTDYDRRVSEALSVAFARPDVVAARDRIARALTLPTTGPQF